MILECRECHQNELIYAKFLCRTCYFRLLSRTRRQKMVQLKYYGVNHDKILEKNRQYAKSHKEYYKEYFKKYYAEHRVELLEYSKRYRAKRRKERLKG